MVMRGRISYYFYFFEFFQLNLLLVFYMEKIIIIYSAFYNGSLSSCKFVDNTFNQEEIFWHFW